MRLGPVLFSLAFVGVAVLPPVSHADTEGTTPPRKKVGDLDDGPKKIELDEADYLLRNFETYADSLKGEKGELTPDAKRALQKVSDLRKRFPEDTRVRSLFDRARAAAKKLQGVTLEITPAMLAYREQKEKNAERLAGVSVEAWEAYRQQVAGGAGAIVEALPAPNPESVPLSDIRDSAVVLEGVRYPDDLFKHYGLQVIAVGSPERGYYFIDVSHRRFIAAYEAIRRYQRRVTDQIPDTWTLVGRVVSVQVMVPETGGVQIGAAYPGWIVEPEAIYVPGKVFAAADPDHELGGSFAGEAEMMEILADQFTVREVPEGVTPEALVGVFLTALKERNYELYLDCIDPAEQQTATQKEWLQRKYDIFQRRLSNDYVHVAVHKADPVEVLQGGESAADEDLLAEFLDDDTVAREREHRLPRIEQQRLWLHLYDETGKVREAPKAVVVRRQENVDDNRWFIDRGFPF